MAHSHRFIESYVHGGRIGVLAELAFDLSFTAGLPEFKQLAKNLARQIAAVPSATVEELLAQTYVKEPAVTVAQIIDNASLRLGDHVVVTRFVRWDTKESHPPPGPPRTPAVAARAAKTA